MKILYDHQIFDKQRYGGISRYFCELVRGALDDSKMDYWLPLSYSENQYLKELGLARGLCRTGKSLCQDLERFWGRYYSVFAWPGNQSR